MKQFLAIFLFVFLTSLITSAQVTIPHVKGNVIISVKKGTFECDITLSNMPRISDYFLRLNSGMNIRYIKNSEPYMLPLRYEQSLEDTMSYGESSAYYIPAMNESGKYLPRTVRFNYVGMFPVINDSICLQDWKGNIAFNGKTLRADGMQSAWCPILYDIKTDTRYENVTYDLDITCDDCKMIYINGSQPAYGPHAKLSSNMPQELTLFAGDFNSLSIDGDYFLNADADIQLLTELNKTLHSYQTYFENKLGIPYKGKITYIQTTPVSKNNSWFFATFPTIVKVGWGDGMKSFSDKEKRTEFLQFMAHELSHYYFGTVRSFNSEIGDLTQEGFSELLALHITQKLISDSLYMEKIQSKVNELQNFSPVPLAKIRSNKDYKNRELYVYYYAPLLFSAIQKEIGEEKMWIWMKALLLSPTEFTNYTFFEQTLQEAVKDKTKSDILFEKYFNSEKSFQNILSTLNIQTNELPAGIIKKPVIETYYYFFFSRPFLDIGSSGNNMIVHTNIGQISCTYEELLKMQKSIFTKVNEECKNDSGCCSDFNLYESMESAQSALKQWLDKFNKNRRMNVTLLKI